MYKLSKGRNALISAFAVAVVLLTFAPGSWADDTTPAKADKSAPAVTAGPGEAFAKEVITRNKPSRKDTFDTLMPLTGTWDYEVFLWTAPASDKPQQSGLGMVENSMVLDDHYLSGNSHGSINIGGQSVPMEGQELIGYDTAKNAYVFSAADTVTTGLATGQASFDAKKHVFSEKGSFTNPLTGKTQAFRAELALTDDNHYSRTVFTADKAGHETKLIEIDYTRRN